MLKLPNNLSSSSFWIIPLQKKYFYSTYFVNLLHRNNYKYTLQNSSIQNLPKNHQNKSFSILHFQKLFFSSQTKDIHLINVPKMGDSITEGTISSWKKNIGEIVKVDEVICVIETDKVSVDIHADVAGKILSYAAEEGETVYVGGDLVSLDISISQEIQNEQASILMEKTKENFSRDTKYFNYKPMIKFPSLLRLDNKNTFLSEFESNNKHPEVRLSNQISSLPRENIIFHQNQIFYRNLTDEEIEIINNGGISDNMEYKFGKWKP